MFTTVLHKRIAVATEHSTNIARGGLCRRGVLVRATFDGQPLQRKKVTRRLRSSQLMD